MPAPHTPDPIIRETVPGDAGALARIYNHFVTETIVTFEEEEVSVEEFARRIAAGLSRGFPWLTAERKDRVLGYAYASAWRTRSAYRKSAETTVYVDADRGRRGIGSLLYGRLLTELKAAGYHAAIGGIALPNEASVRVHERLGFEKVAHFREVGCKFGEWIDVGYWQRLL